MMKSKIKSGLVLTAALALFGFVPNLVSASEVMLTGASCFPIGSPP